MELDLPMMEISYAFGRELEHGGKTLHQDARTLGARWLRGRIESSPILRWNPVRKKALELTKAVAADAIKNSDGAKITAEELAKAIRKMGQPDGKAKFLLQECPF